MTIGKLLISLIAATAFASTSAQAETPLERGTYLMKSIVACGNCHTPQSPAGPAQGMELAGQFLMSIEQFKIGRAHV